MKKSILLVIILPWLFYCAAPRNVSHTGRVTQKRYFTFGADVSGNVPSSILKALYSGLENAISDSLEGDSLLVDQTTLDMTKALLTYSLDPITATSGFYIRYGLINRMDIGFRMAGG